MKPMALPLSVVALGIVTPVALAQGSSDPVMQLRTCSQLEGAARLQCLERLSKDIAPPPAQAAAPPAGRPAADNWLISETTSPVDYTPVVTATTRAPGDADPPIAQLAIHCRSRRTELVFAGPAQADVLTLSLRVDAGPPVTMAAAAPASGPGVAVRGDVVALLRSLPEGGELTVRIATRRGPTHEGRFSLQGLTMVREKVSAACQWPRN